MAGGALGRIVFGLLMLYTFAVPWEYSLDLGEPFGNVARVLGILLFLATGLLVLWRGEVRTPGVVQWWVLGLYLYFVCSYFWTVDQEVTLGKIRAYSQVMMVVWLAWEVAGEGDLEEKLGGLVWLTWAFVMGCWVLAGLTFLDFAGLATGTSTVAAEQIRFAAEGQDPNDVARFLDLGFPLAAWLFTTERRWWVRVGAIAYLPAGLMAVLLTASRGGFTAATVAMVGSVGLMVLWRPRAAFGVLAGLAGTAAVLLLIVPLETLERLATIPAEVGSGDWNDRLNIWVAGWRAFAEAPWWGTGAGTFTTAAGLAPGDTAHNTAMAMLVTAGLVGTAIFAAIVVAVAIAVWRTRGLLRVALGTVLVVWGITSMVGSVEENRTTWLLFALMAIAGRQGIGSREQGVVKARLAVGYLQQANL